MDLQHDQLVGVGTGNGRSNNPLMSEKMAVLAPIPMARVSRATVVKPGDFFNIRAEKLMSRRKFSSPRNCHSSLSRSCQRPAFAKGLASGFVQSPTLGTPCRN